MENIYLRDSRGYYKTVDIILFESFLKCKRLSGLNQERQEKSGLKTEPETPGKFVVTLPLMISIIR